MEWEKERAGERALAHAMGEDGYSRSRRVNLTCLECALRLPLGSNSRHAKAHTMGEDCNFVVARTSALSVSVFLSE